MTKWDEINCRTSCGRCNHKGTVSGVMKGSKVCLQIRKETKRDEGFSLIRSFKQLFSNKGKMRAFGKIKQVEKNE